MKKVYYLLLFTPFLIFGQSNNATINTKTLATKTNIQNQFSNAMITEYQTSAINNIKDFYNYINLYQSSEITNEFKLEIDKSIQNLFLNNSIQLKNIFENSNETLSLENFLNLCKSKSVEVLVGNFSQNKTISDSYFTFQYTIEVIVNSRNTKQIITQKVYFFPSEKEFGTTKKNVWQLKLGEF